jgi:CubicO group peptidase (beta-lactamase class C family)
MVPANGGGRGEAVDRVAATRMSGVAVESGAGDILSNEGHKMKHTAARLIVGLIGFAMLAATTSCALLLHSYRDDVDLFMESRMIEMEVPGMAVGVVGPDDYVWEGYYGTYDGENPVSENTLFMIASVSKTVVATAIMQLWEQDLFALDDDINDYLDFTVRNPGHPDAAITFRHLMTHRSSIVDRYPFYDDLYTIDSGSGDSPWGLGEFLRAYLLPDGEFYDGANFLQAAPGDKFDYANYGAMLLAYLVEVLSGEAFSDYCADHIFTPLGMDNSYYLISDIPDTETEIATPFCCGEALPHYSYPDYPAGSLRTTIRDLSIFASFYLGISAGTETVLKPETIELMFGEYGDSKDLGEGQMGLIWVHMTWVLFGAVGHTGGDPGVSTVLLLYPDEEIATILLMNGSPNSFFLQREVMGRLHDQASGR